MQPGFAYGNSVVALRNFFLDAAIEKLMLEEKYRVIVANRRLDEPFGIRGRSGRNDFNPWRMDKMHLRVLRMKADAESGQAPNWETPSSLKHSRGVPNINKF